MDTVVKIRYFVRTGDGWKFKRNVPPSVRGFADVHSAWVERPTGRTAEELKRQGNKFARRTDVAITKARLKKAGQQASVAANPAKFSLPLDDQIIEDLAALYFQKHDRVLREANAYVPARDATEREEQLESAYADRADALNALQAEETRTPWKVMEFLNDLQIIDPAVLADEKATVSIIQDLQKLPAFRSLCGQIEQADYSLAARVVDNLMTGSMPPLPNPAFSRTIRTEEVTKRLTGKTVADLKKAFIQDKKEEALTVSRLSQYNIAFRVMEEFLGGDCLLSAITRDQCKEIAQFLPSIPAYAAQHYKGMKLRDAAAAYEAKNGSTAGRSKEAAKSLAVMAQAMDFAVNEDWVQSNQFKAVKVPRSKASKKKYLVKEERYEPFTIDELNKIFVAPLYTGCQNDQSGFSIPGPNKPRRHRFWAPLIALFSGMRMNEVLQLEQGDLRREDGVWFFCVTDEEEIEYDPQTFEKRVKNVNSVRDIPVHPTLIQLGLVTWVGSRGPGRIFPEATQGLSEKPSNLFSKRFKTFLESEKVNVWKPRRKVFHSFRGTFNDALRDGGAQLEHREAVNGWQLQQSMDRRYGRGHKVKLLFEAVKSVRYDGLKLDHLLSDGVDGR